MVVIRGATTIPCDTKEEIRRAVSELLEQIESRNSLKREEVVSLVFSSTSDIHSYYPAKAAREAGFVSCSLFSAQEPDIDGGLPRRSEAGVAALCAAGAAVLLRRAVSSLSVPG